MRGFVVMQAATGGDWRIYLHGRVSDRKDPIDLCSVPIWLPDRSQALRFDEQEARQFVEQFAGRYRRVVLHFVEAVL